MKQQEVDAAPQHAFLNFLCIPIGEAWRVYAAPTWMPDYLRRCFSPEGEAYPVYLDLEDLERLTKKRGLAIEQTTNRHGYVELMARDKGARELAIWLANAFSSGFRGEEARPRTKTPSEAG